MGRGYKNLNEVRLLQDYIDGADEGGIPFSAEIGEIPR